MSDDVYFNGYFYTVTLPGGETWTFDPEDRDIAVIDEALYAWSRWRDYVEENHVS